MKVAIVYDRVNKWGGAERVLLTLHEIFPKAPLYTSVYDPIGAPWAKVFPEVVTSFLQNIPFAKSNHEFLAPLMPFAFRSFDFSKYDLVISVTSEAAKGIKVKGKTKHICYCLTPTRYLWSGYKEYFKGSLFKNLTKPVVSLLRTWDRNAAQKPDTFVAISTEVQNRIKKYYGRKSEIVFPPVELSIHRSNNNKKKYYLLVSRLDYGYKKVDLAIKAFNNLGLPLVIVGTGREEKKLKKLAKSNIFFAGRVDETKLNNFYSGAKALIMPQEEDFGIVAVEAQSFGVPVIAFKKGGSLDTIIPSRTGIFFDKQTVKSLVDAVKHFNDSNHWNKNASGCIKNAKRFSSARFKKEILALVDKYIRMLNTRS
jgi:glycosyltransferase involved in cell wall biosynthesis